MEIQAQIRTECPLIVRFNDEEKILTSKTDNWANYQLIFEKTHTNIDNLVEVITDGLDDCSWVIAKIETCRANKKKESKIEDDFKIISAETREFNLESLVSWTIIILLLIIIICLLLVIVWRNSSEY